MIPEQLRKSLEIMIQSHFTKDWTVAKHKNKLLFRWQGYEETEFVITWHSQTNTYFISGNEIPLKMLLKIIDFLEKY